MFDFHEKRKIRSMLYSKPVIGVLILLSGLLAVSAYNRYEIAVETKARLEQRQAELTKLEERARILEQKVEHLENERGVEEELRNRFDVAREGEDVIIIIGEEDDEIQSLPIQATPEEGENTSFFSRLKFW